MQPSEVRRVAEAVLRGNDCGGYTVPARSLYPHQWNWDSAFCAIGWAHIDARRAARELEMLLRGQWHDGMIPHIIFNPDAEHYEPGPQAWRTEGAAPATVRTSSITQPPVAATAARFVLERSGGDGAVEASLRLVARGLERWHRWFAESRDPRGRGRVCIVHPWESGIDNAPRWDGPLARIQPRDVVYVRKDDAVVDPSQRPTRYDYDRYYFLVRERARLGFAAPSPETEPFLVEDVAASAILCRAEEDLAALAGALGVESDAAMRHERWRRGLDSAWQGDRFHDYDVVGGAPIAVDHAAHLLPLFAGVRPDIGERLRVRLMEDYAAPWPVPSLSPASPLFDRRRYWRGPTWINVNWMIIEGLARAGAVALAEDLTQRTLELVSTSGFYEYFDPLNGEGLGAADFAWTAALVIDLLERQRRQGARSSVTGK